MILLDTCTLLWLVGAPEGLSPKARSELEAPRDLLVYVSPVTAFEIAQKVAKAKLNLPATPEAWWAAALKQAQAKELPVSGSIALRAAALPPLHNDPFDRLLIATAQEHHFTLLTPDPKIRAYPDLKTLW